MLWQAASHTYVESSLPILTGIVGPPHIETASAPATAIMSAQDTNHEKEKEKKKTTSV